MSSEQRLNQVLAVFLRAAEAGETPDRQELLARHPDLAAELKAFFADHDRLRQLAAPLRPVGEALPLSAEAPTLAPDGGFATAVPLGTIRYLGDYELLAARLPAAAWGWSSRPGKVSLNRTVAVKMILAGQLCHRRRTCSGSAPRPRPRRIWIIRTSCRSTRSASTKASSIFSMKLVEGESLAAKVASELQSQPRSHRRTDGRSCRRAVHYAHQRGILHRDLKPANVLLDARRHAIVTDFGLAKTRRADDGGTQSPARSSARRSYMAPEQAERRDKGRARRPTCIRLGAILYEC